MPRKSGASYWSMSRKWRGGWGARRSPTRLGPSASALTGRAIPAPPTFLTAVTNDDPDKGGLLRLLNVDIGLILHGEQHYEYLAPVHVGDKITCQQKVVDIYDKKGGALWFVVSETELKGQDGKPVAKAKGITVVRNPDAAKK